MTRTVTSRENPELVPVTVTVYAPANPVELEQESVDIPEAPNVTICTSSLQAKPLVGEMLKARPTDPVKPLTGVTDIEDVIGLPASTVTDVGLADRVKSRTL